MENRKIEVTEENLNIIKRLVMYAYDDKLFKREIWSIVYNWGKSQPWEVKSKYRDKLHEVEEILRKF